MLRFWIRWRSFPHVWLMTRRDESWPGDYIEPDNYANGRLAADWLAEQGARRWVFLSTEPGLSRLCPARGSVFAPGWRTLTFRSKLSGEIPWKERIIWPLRRVTSKRIFWPSGFLIYVREADGVYLPSDGVCGPFFRALTSARGDPPDSGPFWDITTLKSMTAWTLSLRPSTLICAPSSAI